MCSGEFLNLLLQSKQTCDRSGARCCHTGRCGLLGPQRCLMRVSILTLTVLFAVITGLTGSPVQASWKSSVLGDSINPPVTIPARKTTKRVYRKPRKARSIAKKVKRSKSNGKRARRRGSMRGMASYYWQRQRVASGGWFNPNALTAAHKTLRFGTRVRVTNLRNGRSVIVRINDRGPYIKGRIIDLSRRAAGVVGMRKSGVAPVRVDIL